MRTWLEYPQMSKKKKQNLQRLIAKKQQLQQVAQGAAVSFKETPVIVPAPKVEEEIITLPNHPVTTPLMTMGAGRELKKTTLSIVLIALLLIAAVVFDRKTPYLNHFGDWLYRALRLQS